MNSCYAFQTTGFTLADAAIIFAALGALTFVCAYAVTTGGAWRNSTVGINVMAFMSAIAIVSVLAAAGIFWGTDWPYRTPVRTAAWGSIGVCVWWRVVILFRVQRPLRDDRAVRRYPERHPPA